MCVGPNISNQVINGKEYKVHLDGYDQTDMLTRGGKSARNELWYFTQSRLAAVRLGDLKFQLLGQPAGWFGPTVQLGWPLLYNLRLDPFERMGITPDEAMMAMQNYYGQAFCHDARGG